MTSIGKSTAEGVLDRPATVRVAGVDVPTGLFLGGEWRPSASGSRFPVEDPRTGDTLGHVADADPADAEEALDGAARTQPEWGRRTPRERATILSTAFDLVRARREDLSAVIAAETGKPLTEARGEVDYGGEFLRWFAEQTAHLHGDYAVAPNGGFRVLTTKVPIGPCLLITPWNFPLAMVTRKVGAALAAGCTAILKPAEQTPLTAALMVDLLHQAGVPEGVVSLLPTTGAAAQSQQLMSDPRLRKVSFTGSTAVGSTLLTQAAPHIMCSSMELGGNAPFLVLADADIPAAVQGAMLAKFRNGGQSCVAANRFLVHADVAEAFTSRLTEQVEKLTSTREPDGQLGPLIDRRQRQRVADLVEDAVRGGARVRCGGAVVEGDGYFYQGTVLDRVPHDAPIARQEIFGPVATVTTVTSDRRAVDLANDTPYGLAAFVYTRDLNRAMYIAEALEAGMVGVNRGLVSEPSAPFGGVKASGLGREGGPTGIEHYLETKAISLDLPPLKA